MGAAAGGIRVADGMHTVHNARVQLVATLLNTAAGSSFTVGVAAPIAAAIFYNPGGLRISLLVIGVAVWIIIAILLHLGAQLIIGRLRST